MAMTLYIMPKAYREKVGPQEYSEHPVAAGPYKITEVNGVTEVDMERYDGYYADSPKGKPAIGKIIIHEVPDSATEMAELLGGRADWIWKFSPDQFDVVGRMPNLQAIRAESMRVEYLGMDAAGRTGADNPLTKEKVRQAIVLCDRSCRRWPSSSCRADRAQSTRPAIRRSSAATRLRRCTIRTIPAKAKQLLAEAGYPNGFDTELVTYELPQWAGAVQGYLKAVGINAKIISCRSGRRCSVRSPDRTRWSWDSWGSYSVNDVSAILPNFFTFTGNDYTRDPEIKKLVEAGGATVDPDQRRKAYSAAIKLITEKASLDADLHPHGDLRLLEAAQLQAISGRAAAVLPASWK